MPRPVEFYWWEGSELEAFIAKVNRYGSNNVRVKFYPPESTNHDKAGLLFVEPVGVVVALGGGEEGDNFVHVCPPDCPPPPPPGGGG